MMNRLKLAVMNHFAKIHESPVIVLGNQKSGTSAIAHLLADLCGLSKTVDIPPLWPPTVAEIMKGRISFASVVEHNKFYFSTQLIKEPNLTFMADQVMAYFPKAGYVFIIRDPRDNIRSLLNQRGLAGNLEEAVISDKQFQPGGPKHFRFAPDIWGAAEDENYIAILARRWNVAANVFLEHRDRLHLVRYEDFLADKVGCLTKVANTLGLEAKYDITDKVDIQYQPAGNRNVSWQDFYGPTNLSYIEDICGNIMNEFGYSTLHGSQTDSQ